MKKLKVVVLFLLAFVLIKSTPAMALDSTSLTIGLGSTPGLYNGMYFDGYNKTWQTADPSVVSITGYSGSNCYIKAKAIGTCDIIYTVKYTEYGIIDYVYGKPIVGPITKSYSCIYHITVTQSGIPEPGTIDVSDTAFVLEGEHVVFDYSIQSTEGKYIYNYNKLYWKSSNPSVASVNQIGVVTGWSKGSAIITVTTANGVSDKCTINVGVPNGFTPISTAQQLSNIRNNPTGNYILTKNIIFSDADFKSGGAFYNNGAGWMPIDGFSGTLEGNGFSIQKMCSTSSNVGLFNNLTGAVRNLEIKDSFFTATNAAGAFVGYSDSIHLINCKSTNNKIKGDYAGGLAGKSSNRGYYQKCTNSSTITGRTATGGIAGNSGMFSKLKLCSNKGVISNDSGALGDVGGLVGLLSSYSEVRYCWNEGSVSGAGYTGGLFGLAGYGSRIYESYNKGKVTGTGASVCLGGITGREYFTYAENCYNSGTLELINPGNKEAIMGGIVGNVTILGYSTGDNVTFFLRCINVGALKVSGSGTPIVGGIGGTITGLPGVNSETIAKNCYYLNTTSVIGFERVFVGRLENITALTAAQMTSATNFKDFDFAVVWRMKSGETYPRLCFQDEVGKIGVLDAPIMIKGETINYASAKISWTPSSHANAYELYRATSSTGNYTLIKTTTSTNYTDNTIIPGATYYYKVRAVHNFSTKKIYSVFTTGALVKTTFSVPKSVKATAISYNSVKLSWNAVAGANGYEVYQSTSSTGKYTAIASINALTYTKKGLNTNTAYYYKIRAYRWVGKTKVYGGFSTVAGAKPILAVPLNNKAVKVNSTSIKLTWGSVSGASGYEIYQSFSKTGLYTKIKTTTVKYYTNSKLKKGKTYYYKLRAYRMVGKNKVYSGWSTIVYIKL